MARVLFINVGSEGHINPTLGLVRELIHRGEDVVYFTGDEMRERVGATGAKVIACDSNALLEAFLSGGRHPWGRVVGLLRIADVILPSLLEQTRGEHFDYIIHDSMFGCGRLIAQKLDLPAVNSCTSFMLDQTSFNRLQEMRLQQYPADVNEQAELEFHNLVSEMQRKYGVQVDSPYEIQWNPAALTIVYTSKEFQPNGEHFDESFKFVGPSIVSRSNDKFDVPDVDLHHLIYISLGTVFNQSTDFYKLCFEAFANTEYTVILSVGSRTQIADLGTIPPNFIVRNYVPQLEVLQQAAVFITHGGMNSTSEALFYGVPLIVLPQMADQPMIARRIAEAGAGIHLEEQGLTAANLRTAVAHVLTDPSFKEGCERIGDTFRAGGGYRRAVDEVFAYKRSLGITQ